MSEVLEQRFWGYVKKSASCWNWCGGTSSKGYGHFNLGHGESVSAHRYAYQLAVGPIPEGLTIDHLCRNRRCVNPEHLEAVSGRENTLRGNTLAARNTVATHCVRGHEFTPSNTRTCKLGKRHCRQCSYEHLREWRIEQRRLGRKAV